MLWNLIRAISLYTNKTIIGFGGHIPEWEPSSCLSSITLIVLLRIFADSALSSLCFNHSLTCVSTRDIVSYLPHCFLSAYRVFKVETCALQAVSKMMINWGTERNTKTYYIFLPNNRKQIFTNNVTRGLTLMYKCGPFTSRSYVICNLRAILKKEWKRHIR